MNMPGHWVELTGVNGVAVRVDSQAVMCMVEVKGPQAFTRLFLEGGHSIGVTESMDEVFAHKKTAWKKWVEEFENSHALTTTAD